MELLQEVGEEEEELHPGQTLRPVVTQTNKQTKNNQRHRHEKKEFQLKVMWLKLTNQQKMVERRLS